MLPVTSSAYLVTSPTFQKKKILVYFHTLFRRYLSLVKIKKNLAIWRDLYMQYDLFLTQSEVKINFRLFLFHFKWLELWILSYQLSEISLKMAFFRIVKPFFWMISIVWTWSCCEISSKYNFVFSTFFPNKSLWFVEFFIVFIC